MTISTPEQCPCGSGGRFADCCQPYHLGNLAPTPEILMRSRYSAFVVRDENYLLNTWHESTCPPTLSLDDGPDWASLRILDSGEDGDHGRVHFQAIYRTGKGWAYLEEESDFVRESGCWFYVSGDTTEGTLKPGRNDECPCGSGRKYKACCL